MYYKPTIVALNITTYRCFNRRGLSALLLAIAPVTVSAGLVIGAGHLGDGWPRNGLQLVMVFLQLIYVTAVVRTAHAKAPVYWPYRIGRDELRVVLAALIILVPYYISMWLFEILSGEYESNRLVTAMIGVMVVYAFGLRMVVLVPLIVLERMGPLGGVLSSWGKTSGIFLITLVSAVVCVGPLLLVTDFVASLVGGPLSQTPLNVYDIEYTVQSYLNIGIVSLFSYAVYVTPRIPKNVGQKT
ncbi:MAG: hypothetical protein JKY27_04700 [Magnetovibrio sp.]|nr:hypothetical protein [Magnetovibrio sp.]